MDQGKYFDSLERGSGEWSATTDGSSASDEAQGQVSIGLPGAELILTVLYGW